MARPQLDRWLAAAALAVVVVVTALMSLQSAPPASRASDTQLAIERPAAIVVRAHNVEQLGTVDQRARASGFRVVETTEDPPSLLIVLPEEVSLAEGVEAFVGAKGVLYVEPAYPVRAYDLPSDPLFAQAQRGYLDLIAAPQAWDITTGAPNVVVAVLDTGLFVQHPDLAGRIWTNPREVAGNAIDDDGNGCVDDVNGCTFLHSPAASCTPAANGNIADDAGHGTFVAGIISAAANGVGMVGIARNATILPVKVLDCTGSGNTFSLAQGILYAGEHGARVINVSLGGPVDSAYVREAIRAVRQRYGTLVVAATGNSGGAVSYPAKYSEALAVGGTDAAGTGRAGFSNSGPEVDVVAPSVGIVGTAAPTACERFNCLENNRDYAIGDGTSFAAPMVTGLAALILSRNPFLSPDAVSAMITSTADPLPAGDRPGWAGAGRVNMLRALQLPFRLGAPGTARN